MFVRNPLNEGIYRLLNQIADLLELQEASAFRINAYRNASTEIAKMPDDLQFMARKGQVKQLESLPAIGRSIANIIVDYYRSGHSRYLNRLQGEVSFEQVLERIPGIGPALAQRILGTLEIDTLEELEQATYDGRLTSVPGFGEARLQLVQMALHGLLDRRKHWQSSFEIRGKIDKPKINILFEIDKDYRQLDVENKLQRIAPKRFNPGKKAWLPIYHTDRDGWHFTVLYSNTARAHQLHKQIDWVIIYYQKDSVEGQVTVVTETRGPLKGKRVVRGDEEDSEKYYSLPLFIEWQTD
ncbi:MAG: DNA-binding protein [Saprospiraceae bacterium]|nr:DNA-binding protein [Saprospiraceae bacterium]